MGDLLFLSLLVVMVVCLFGVWETSVRRVGVGLGLRRGRCWRRKTRLRRRCEKQVWRRGGSLEVGIRGRDR